MCCDVEDIRDDGHLHCAEHIADASGVEGRADPILKESFDYSNSVISRLAAANYLDSVDGHYADG